jgi:hypothetical protein
LRRASAAVQDALRARGFSGDGSANLDELRAAATTAEQRFEEVRVVAHGAAQGREHEVRGVAQAIADNAAGMRDMLETVSDALVGEYQELQERAAAFATRRDELRARYEELVTAEGGRVTEWHRDVMKGDVLLEPEAGFKPRRLGSQQVPTTGRTPNAQVVFAD